MTAVQIQNAIDHSVVWLTRNLAAVESRREDIAFREVYKSELFKLLSDERTRLFLEPNTRLFEL